MCETLSEKDKTGKESNIAVNYLYCFNATNEVKQEYVER